VRDYASQSATALVINEEIEPISYADNAQMQTTDANDSDDEVDNDDCMIH
jgi:hypothetical protein